MFKRAVVLVLDRPPYNGRIIKRALQKMDVKIVESFAHRADADCAIITWNRYRRNLDEILEVERAGGTSIIIENSYLGRTLPHGPWYAMSKWQHNGVGETAPPDLQKWARIPYDKTLIRHSCEINTKIVVLATRHMGSEQCREPNGWSENICRILQRKGWDARIRKHPGPQGVTEDVPLLDDIKDCYACVTWGSSAGVKALLAGIPVFYGLQHWIGCCSAKPIHELIKLDISGEYPRPPRIRPPDLTLLQAKLATAIVSLGEIETGEAFKWI